MPAVPDDIRDAYDAQVLAQIAARAQDWVVHKDLKGEYATTLDFYKAVAKEVAPGAAPEGPSKRGRWEILKAAVQTDGEITAVPWTRFNDTEAPLLEAELLNCPVQIAGSGRSTAAHGNKHGKLPKPVALVDGKTIDHLEPKAQMDKTPYFEFLISGGHKKTRAGSSAASSTSPKTASSSPPTTTRAASPNWSACPASVVADSEAEGRPPTSRARWLAGGFDPAGREPLAGDVAHRDRDLAAVVQHGAALDLHGRELPVDPRPDGAGDVLDGLPVADSFAHALLGAGDVEVTHGVAQPLGVVDAVLDLVDTVADLGRLLPTAGEGDGAEGGSGQGEELHAAHRMR